MIDQPLAVFPNINEGVSAANFVPGSSHGEFVQANIGAPTGSDRNVALQNSAGGLTLQKVLKVVPDGIVIGSGDVGNGWQQNGTGGRIPSRNGVWIFGNERVVPQMEQILYLLLGNFRCRRRRRFRCCRHRLGGLVAVAVVIREYLSDGFLDAATKGITHSGPLR